MQLELFWSADEENIQYYLTYAKRSDIYEYISACEHPS